MNDNMAASGSDTASDRLIELRRTPQSVVARHHRTLRGGGSAIRPRDARGLCDDGRPEWRGLHVYACEGGSRASWRDAGCSAGKSASSLQSPCCHKERWGSRAGRHTGITRNLPLWQGRQGTQSRRGRSNWPRAQFRPRASLDLCISLEFVATNSLG